jgi:KEOPS complex subunit Cgi121
VICLLSDFNMYAAITGFGNARVGDVNEFFNTVRSKLANVAAIQFFDAELVATWQHLYFAAVNALTVFANKTNISNNLAMETLLYASAQRQIKKATEMMGIKPKTTNIAVLIIAENQKSTTHALKSVQKLFLAEQDDSALELNEEKIEKIKQFFDISDLELAAKLEKKGLETQALVDLVIEHMALLVTRR